MASADVEDGRATMLRADRLVMISVRSRVGEVSLGHEMNCALDDLSSARHHRQGQKEGEETYKRRVHILKYRR